MEIFPAIDLKEGKAVRLYKGEMASAKIYGEAFEFAKKFQDLGSKWIHIVDLDGALGGEPKNLEVIEKIRKNSSVKIQIGGGIRDEQTIRRYSDMGIDRLILGSAALKDPVFAKEMARKYKIAVGIDSKDGKVALEGWVKSAEIDALDLAKEFKGSDIQALICTDIQRDGTFEGINLDLTLELARVSDCFCIASGGVKNEQDIYNLNEKFEEHAIRGGVIIGKAYYEGRIDLQKVIKKFTPNI
ncbi:1-(5-phosphoribosyl)-5-[(5-phosphoribosylamino)methylideneamino]imidazole-4-carboxamide isomerase [Helicobacter cappadocius]|uniref:1-(5-phosphoribosyl)-5-[(5-phosphoribosylamino)methylideneamino] imidazole-4-carboxamide isomerase n=1 Tax=Helicobacter cappadocius TaxID=3063998 RepID=A0AA90PPF0_9HELI|nr:MULTISPECIES: 1-(5-phosphoribosyl)-5-[(5-phosphoribosylamino)methylideneamino]imidazole-4-carboxamide isomerase [unclassified Helicobacter]MDO7252329.1 1-(5-phosphoribosyl)-5-[(5-phosphoribosylamino)methylideneamino]imidazole-4-carboxamide isomerase [Helicobacter sp. faydin-H75]MDP2538196.1 1-(5-phosphoribosyl)-5-[(5-phosphoribosylamino)methylideneamino]imidazole-4-carboxamide isomerase [Helicobacter sp. faydin-H76]